MPSTKTPTTYCDKCGAVLAQPEPGSGGKARPMSQGDLVDRIRAVEAVNEVLASQTAAPADATNVGVLDELERLCILAGQRRRGTLPMDKAVALEQEISSGLVNLAARFGWRV